MSKGELRKLVNEERRVEQERLQEIENEKNRKNGVTVVEKKETSIARQILVYGDEDSDVIEEHGMLSTIYEGIANKWAGRGTFIMEQRR